MRNEGHFLILHELVEEEKVYKDRVNINRADSDKKDLRRRYFLSENNNGISQPQYTFLWLLSCFLSFLAFQLKSWSSGAFLVSRNYLVIFTNSLEAVFKSCTPTRFWSLYAMLRKLNIISFTLRKLPFNREFKIHYGELLLRLLRPWGTRLTTPLPPDANLKQIKISLYGNGVFSIYVSLQKRIRSTLFCFHTTKAWSMTMISFSCVDLTSPRN